MNTLTQWVKSFRPKTLTAAVVPVWVGAGIAYQQNGEIPIFLIIAAMLSALFIQIATNLFNDALDYQKGADNENRVGPRRLVQLNLASPQQVFGAGLLCCFFAIVAAIPLVLVGGKIIVIIGIISLLCAYLYTGGPYPLAYIGLGEIFVILFFGIIGVAGSSYIFASHWVSEAFFAGLQIGLLAAVLIAVNNFRDYQTDASASKLTLSVRFGPLFSRCEIAFFCLAPFVMNFYWWDKNAIWAAALPLLMIPLALGIISDVRENEPGCIYNNILGQSALLHLGFGLLLGIGLFIARGS